MGEQEKEQVETQGDTKATGPGEQPETAATQPPPPQDTAEQAEDQFDKIKDSAEKLWGNTVSAWSTAAFRATQYKRLVQKKTDASALHKKIDVAHAELGKLIDDQREAGKKNILATAPVKALLQRLDELKLTAAQLEEEIETIKREEPEQGPPPTDESTPH